MSSNYKLTNVKHLAQASGNTHRKEERYTLTVVVVLGWDSAVHGGALGVVHVGVTKNSLGVPLYHVRRFCVLMSAGCDIRDHVSGIIVVDTVVIVLLITVLAATIVADGVVSMVWIPTNVALVLVDCRTYFTYSVVVMITMVLVYFSTTGATVLTL